MAKRLQKIMRYVGQHGIVRPVTLRPSAFHGSISFVSTAKAASVGLDAEFIHFPMPT
jgi:hypothetical protein